MSSTDTASVDNVSIHLEKGYADEKAGYPHGSAAHLTKLRALVYSKDATDAELLHNNPGVDKVISQLEEDAGQLGPLENPYDIHKVETHPDPNSDFNEHDPWKYPIDAETGLRIVDWVENDPENPKNTSNAKRWLYTMVLGLTCFVVALGSAIVTGDLERPAAYFGVSEEVIILASVTMFVLGFGFGPLVFAPISEEVGRKPVYVATLGVALVFIVPCGVAKNIGTMIICRLLDGLAFSAPMCLIGGSLADV